MPRESNPRAAGAWGLSFAVTAAVTVCAGLDWLSVLLGSALALALSRWRPAVPGMLQLLWLPALLWVAGQSAGALFPDAQTGVYVPVVTLALAWLLARRAREAALACCAVVSFFVLGAVGFVLLLALPDVQLRWLAPRLQWEHVLLALAVGCGGPLLRAAVPDARPGLRWRAAGALAAPAAAAVTCGCLSPELARGQQLAFYTLSRSISLFGVVERFEALVASCVCMGCCTAAALILSALREGLRPHCGETARDGWTLAAAALAALTPALPISSGVFLTATLILWVLLPLGTQLVVAGKQRKEKMQKPEKNC